MTKLVMTNIAFIIISIIFILLYKKAVFVSIKRMLYKYDGDKPLDTFYNGVNSYYFVYAIIDFIFILIIAVAIAVHNDTKATTIDFEIPSSGIALLILIIGVPSIISALSEAYNSHYCKDNAPKSLLSFILCALSLKYYFLPKIFKDKFIKYNNLINTRIDCTKVKKEASIKKLSIINNYLIPKFDKVIELINKNDKAIYKDSLEYNKRQDELFNSKEEIINEINKLCDEISSIENCTDINSIDKEISELKKSNIGGI